jgi:hypothetical protein
MDKKVGAYSFIGGVVIAIVLGIFSKWIQGSVVEILVSVMVLLGLIVGFLNVAGKQSQEFLIVGVILALVSAGGVTNLAKVMYIGNYLAAIFNYIMAFVIPAVIVAGLKDVVKLSKEH